MRVPCIVRWPGHIAAGPHERRARRPSIDLFPTLAALCGADAAGRPDHRRASTSRRCCSTPAPRHRARRSRTTWMNDLEAVRAGRWKLHVAKAGAPVTRALRRRRRPRRDDRPSLAEHPDEVARLERDRRRRPAGRSATPASASSAPTSARSGGSPTRSPLTTYDPAHPYYAAEYDLPDRG